MNQMNIWLVVLMVAVVTLLGTTIGFLVLWRITVEDRNAVWELYYEAAGLDPDDQLNDPNV